MWQLMHVIISNLSPSVCCVFEALTEVKVLAVVTVHYEDFRF